METTKQASYYTLRSAVSSADTDLTASERTWTYFAANLHESLGTNLSKEIPATANSVQIIFDFATANTDTATFVLYACKDKGPIEYVCTGNLIAGDQETDDATTRYYCDTIGDTSWTDKWIKTIGLSDSGNNRIARINFDACGYKHIICLFTAIGSGSAIAKITWF